MVQSLRDQGHSSTSHQWHKTRTMLIDDVSVSHVVLQGGVCAKLSCAGAVNQGRVADAVGHRDYSGKSVDRQRSMPLHGGCGVLADFEISSYLLRLLLLAIHSSTCPLCIRHLRPSCCLVLQP